MANSFFEGFRQKKDKLIELARKVREYGWIEESRVEDIIEKLNADTLTIGVIGQMKCGKSTFLNAFVFEDDILPSATTPMTAALSVITYGETAKVIAEFYTKDEWLEQQSLAEQALQGLSELDASKVKAAKELVEKSAPIKDNIEEYLGKTCEDSLENIVDYVGADGRFVSITKSVKIFYPKDYLKGVEIVDTPGFNDPIVSRELRTKEFLRKADVVVMMLYAGRPFDSTDRTILFENVKQCGIGKVIIGVNKYDIPYEKGERPEDIKQYVVEQIREQCRLSHDDTMLDILKNAEPILLSAEMALLSDLPMSKVVANTAYDHAFKRYASELDISGQLRLREMSRMDDLANAIRMMVEQEKYDVLLKKPVNSILAAGSQKLDSLITEITNVDAEIKILNTPDDELEEKELNLSKAERRLSRKIEGLGDDLNIAIMEEARKGKNELEDAMDHSCKRMESLIESVKVFETFEKIKPRLNQIAEEFEKRTSKRLVEQLATKIKGKLKSTTRDFFTETTDTFQRYVPDLDSKEFVKEVERQLNLQIEDESIFYPSGSDKEKSNGVWGLVLNAGVTFVFGLIGLGAKSAIEAAFRGINHNKKKNDLLEQINSVRFSFDATPIIDTILVGKDNVINLIKKKFLDELITPLSEQVSKCRESLTQKEEKLLSAKKQIERLNSEKQLLESQIMEVNTLIAAI
ncbi:MAG: dynamin family protein [Bacteroidales bacterium]|nr:dynamin family protein [Bacteroidales bacterium]